jgi:hypothetical protein
MAQIADMIFMTSTAAYPLPSSPTSQLNVGILVRIWLNEYPGS